ncbi:MAG: Holliday junction branch migration protein RuvA [Rhodocyclales bacterium CG17_big_fil_post_rev_8_21_14_2_50_68_7]|nr:MAG: Holliday junction DNA helicase RuvA [Betaproteobacteria bacterium CG2_30_68_42]PIV71825.1 MAG: Holliday junction branch migration protein RuvA [Rhodocyclales bacterium CG17_big_fil_post_rev_8_21_14_2_50_68_7]PIX74340.1 MAG: Holliday junction branch migration protein RuvA [Rhodocyclales bacterium CG_4_10_14_3_um_filter_68_10]PJA58336.1 MAG: Holliday junction branch migration protein RuvA [Rhodocyclales bacterium CG_4_9_14_3_um_filter_68_10]
MIGRLTGILIEKNPPGIALDVQGVGYELEVPMSTFYDLPPCGERVTLHTHLLVREDGHFLYGFGAEPERAVFRQLLRVSGVGARIALAVLSGMSVDELAQAVAMQDAGRLTRVPGIGKKTAARLLLELRDALPRTVSLSRTPAPGGAADILAALAALGYSDKEAQAAVAGLPAGIALAEGIRQALKRLSKS